METKTINHDQILADLKSLKLPSVETIIQIFNEAKGIISKEPNVLQIEPTVVIIGNIAGHFFDLLKAIQNGGEPSENNKYLFLGNYGNRGNHSLESFLYITVLKLKLPNSVFLLRGNHECKEICAIYGFQEEVIKKLGSEDALTHLYDLFNVLPLAAMVGKKIFCVHGGISESIKTIDEISALDRMQTIPHEGPITDLLWSDPNDEQDAPDWKPSPRGASAIFGPKPLAEFVEKNGLDLIIRSHQMIQEGYKYLFNDKLLTVFTPANYCYRCGNTAAIVKIDDKFERKIITFTASEENLATKPAHQ